MDCSCVYVDIDYFTNGVFAIFHFDASVTGLNVHLFLM
jgi:hypothetical protein